MRKVLIILYTLGVGGVEKVCYEIATNVNKQLYQCDFLVAIDSHDYQYYEPLLSSNGLRVYKGGEIVDKDSKKRFLEYEAKLIKEEHYDVVHSHMDFMNVWTLQCAKRMNVPIRISHVHTMRKNQESENLKARIKQELYKKLLCLYSNKRIACSAVVAQEYYGNSESEIIINGFDIKRFMNIKKEDHSRKNLISIGRLSSAKNPKFILGVVRELVSIDNSYKLIWVGGGELRETIGQLIAEYNLSENVIMVGETTDIVPYLKQADIALFPSEFEGLGIAIVEAQLSNCLTYYSEVIPEEAEIGYGIRMDLKSGARAWAEKINDDVIHNRRSDYSINDESAKRYEITHMIEKIESFYGQ